MSVFILQTLALLVLAFILGVLIGRFLKPIFCRRHTLARGDAVSSGSSSSATTQSNAVGFASSAGATAAFAGIKADNLQIIEGIGPKMESVLHENGIMTWSQLAHKEIPELQGILDQHGKRYQIINPSTWVDQAKLAADGNEKDLIELQKRDDHASKLENMLNATKNHGFGKFQPDDLKIVEGIGPKIESLLNSASINTWEALSITEPSVIHSVLDAAGPRYRLAVPETWPLQAKYAVKNEWARLKQYQDELLQGARRAGSHHQQESQQHSLAGGILH